MRARAPLLSLSLLILLLAETTCFRRWELKRRALLLPTLAGLSAEEAELRSSVYDFDPQFGRFLDGVRRLVPEGSSVEVSVPSSTRLYFYTTYYALAPRRVLDAREEHGAHFLAVYRPGAAGDSSTWAVPGGFVRRLR